MEEVETVVVEKESTVLVLSKSSEPSRPYHSIPKCRIIRGKGAFKALNGQFKKFVHFLSRKSDKGISFKKGGRVVFYFE